MSDRLLAEMAQRGEEAFALEAATLRQDNIDLRAEVLTLRELLSQTLALLARANEREQRDREQKARLLDDLRWLRGFLIEQDRGRAA